MAITRLFSTSPFKLLLLSFVSILGACGTPNTSSTTAPGLVRKAFSPTWSPGGDRLAFLYRYRAEGSQSAHDALFTILQNGTDLIKVRDLSPARFDSLKWSPNGALFLLTTEDTEEIYITERNGQNLEKIAEGAQVDWHPSADKFVSVYDNTCQEADRVGGKQCQRQIRLYDIPSKTHIALNIDLPQEVIAPHWSKDGLSISWLSTRTNKTKDLSEQTLQLHNYSLATETYQITEVGPTALSFANAQWSKDQTQLSFDYLSRIYLYFFDTREAFEITTGIQPDLSQDKNRILYTNLIGENRGDIALFNRETESISTVISHRDLPTLE